MLGCLSTPLSATRFRRDSTTLCPRLQFARLNRPPLCRQSVEEKTKMLIMASSGYNIPLRSSEEYLGKTAHVDASDDCRSISSDAESKSFVYCLSQFHCPRSGPMVLCAKYANRPLKWNVVWASDSSILNRSTFRTALTKLRNRSWTLYCEKSGLVRFNWYFVEAENIGSGNDYKVVR